ncbi:MAG: hypothetical protein ACK5CY_00675, partial [Bacteroidia bacterium]
CCKIEIDKIIMAFTLNPSNLAITLAEFNTLGTDFVRFFKTTSATFQGYIYERIGRQNLIDLLDDLSPQGTEYIKGMRIIPTLRGNNTMRFVYVPTVLEEIDAFGSYRIFESDTNADPELMFQNTNCYWVQNDDFVLLTGTNLSTAEDDYQRYLDEILISHDGSGTNFDVFDSAIDTTSALSNLPAFVALAEDNKNNNQAPDYFYMLSCAEEFDGNIVHTFATGVYTPGTTQGNGQGNGAFTNNALNNYFLCPPNCKKLVTVNNRLAIP